MELKTYFIIGTNGIGKSAVLARLRELLPEERFMLYDFDQRGVPDNAGKEWRKKETRSWLMLAEIHRQENKQTVVVGFVKPEEIEEMSEDLENKPVMILLDGTPHTVTERIKQQYSSEESVKELLRVTGSHLEKYITNAVYYGELLKELRFIHNFKVIKTDDRTPTEISAEIMQFIFEEGREKRE